MTNIILKAFVSSFSYSLGEIAQMCTCKHFRCDENSKLFRCICGGKRREAGIPIKVVLCAKDEVSS